MSDKICPFNKEKCGDHCALYLEKEKVEMREPYEKPRHIEPAAPGCAIAILAAGR